MLNDLSVDLLSSIWVATCLRTNVIQLKSQSQRLNFEQRSKLHMLDDPEIHKQSIKVKTKRRTIQTASVFTLNSIIFRQVNISKNNRSDRCNRNEKLFTEPLLTGVQGVKYINDIHNRYFFQTRPRSNRQVYDIMPLDDSSKQLIYQGPGFKCFTSTAC